MTQVTTARVTAMEDLVYRPGAARVQGWGVGHQGEAKFSTIAPDFDYAQMPYGLPSHRPESPESFSDIEDENYNPEDALYRSLDLGKVLGQQLAVWTHRSPDTVGLFTPVMGDTFYNVMAFARASLQFDSMVDKVTILLPGHRRPVDMNDVFLIKPGTSILLTPRYDYMITMEVKQLGQKLEMVVDITMTVRDLKERLQSERGYPVGRVDLLYRDRPMENTRYLFEYRLVHGSTIFALLSLVNNVMVHVETFWGKRYHLYVDPCTTGLSIIASILRRTVSQNVTDVVRLYELFLPKHTLVLYLGSRVVDWNTCLGFYNIVDGHVLRMSTIGLAHDMAIQKVPVVFENDQQHTVLVSKFDRWSAVVLKIHGMTGYPVNLMRLVRHNATNIDFSDSVGHTPSNSQPVKLDLSKIRNDDDLIYGVPLKFRFGHGVTELLKVAPNRTIKSVKDTLERVGVPNASLYDFDVDGCRLPNNKRVVDVIDEYKVPIELVLRQYPVFVHGPQNIIYKFLIHKKEILATFLMRIEMKTGLAFDKHVLLINGTILDELPETPVFKSPIAIRSSLFYYPRKKYRTFFIINNDWLNKLRLPEYPKLHQIKDILWKERNVPEGSLASVANILQWFFGPKSRDNGKTIHQHQKGEQIIKEPRDMMRVYEAKSGKDSLFVKTENTNTNKNKSNTLARLHHRPKLKKQLETNLKDLEALVAKQDALRKRSMSLPPGNTKVRFEAGNLPRHLSAGNHHLGHHRHRRRSRAPRQLRRAYTTGLEDNEFGVDGVDEEYVFALRHDAGYTTLLPKKGSKKRTGKR